MDSKVMVKCIFIGNLSVGKTSIIIRYTRDYFSGEYVPTIGADFVTIPIKINEEKDQISLKDKHKNLLDDVGLDYDSFLKLNEKYTDDEKIYLWDLAGQPLFKRMRQYYMSYAHMAILVLDLSKPETFQVNNWIKDLKEYSPDAEIIFVGNKSDLVDLKKNTQLERKIKQIEKKYRTHLHIVSAKTGDNIKELFNYLKLRIMLLLQRHT